MDKRSLQRGTLVALRLTGLSRLLGMASSGAGAILTFHRVRPHEPKAFAPNAHLEITPEFLSELIAWARGKRIDIVDLDEAKRRLGSTDAPRFIVLTFDDGYRDNFEWALPVLKSLAAPFTVYVATGFVERTVSPWWLVLEKLVELNNRVADPATESLWLDTSSVRDKYRIFNVLSGWIQSIDEVCQQSEIEALAMRHGIDIREIADQAFMDWSELESIAREPLATIGAHTHSHFALAKISPQAVREEILRSAEALGHRLRVKQRHFAYPYGFAAAVGARDHRIVADLGFETAVLTAPGVLRSDHANSPTAWPRISMNGHFQSIRFVDTLLSGAPFLPANIARRLTSRATVSSISAPASASNE